MEGLGGGVTVVLWVVSSARSVTKEVVEQCPLFLCVYCFSGVGLLARSRGLLWWGGRVGGYSCSGIGGCS